MFVGFWSLFGFLGNANHSGPLLKDGLDRLENRYGSYLRCSGPLLENGLDRPENRHGRYGFASFPSISISTVGVDGTGDSL